MKFLLALALAALAACQPKDPAPIPLPTQICIRTLHHSQPVPNATVYVKYNADTFPGYDQPPSYFDTVFQTADNARGCLAPVPEGHHWLVGYGDDVFYTPPRVRGSLRVDVRLGNHPTVDTILHISEY